MRLVTRLSTRPFLALAAGLLVSACIGASGGRREGAPAPEPQKPVDLARYAGLWHEQARFEASFQRGCEAVTARYSALPDGRIQVVNTCRQDSPDGPAREAVGTATIVPGSNNAKLRVSFFGPFAGDYWVLDRGPGYDWAIVGEPSGRYLWLLTRAKQPGEAAYQTLVRRAAALGYDTGKLRRTRQ